MSAGPVLLSYRPWRGTLRGPTSGMWAIARTSLHMLIRRKLFWGLFGLCTMIFMFFFYGQYLRTWLTMRLNEETVRVALVKLPTDLLLKFLDGVGLNGSGVTFGNFIWFEGYIVMIVLALAGSILVGNDFQFGSLPFYLSKPIHRWHYLGGKFLAVAVFINLMTTIPSLILYVQFGLIDTWDYYIDQVHLLFGILGYGAVLTVCLGLLLLATASWLRRTVPMVMVWTTLFVFGRILANFLVDGLRLDSRWRLIDLWNDMYLLGNWCLGMSIADLRPSTQPQPWEAAVVLTAVCAACAIYLNRRIRAVEVVQ